MEQESTQEQRIAAHAKRIGQRLRDRERRKKPPRFVPASRLDQIVAEVAAFYRIPAALLTGKSRPAHVAGPRMVAMYLARKLTPASLEGVGFYFERDHTTVINAERRIAMEVATSADTAAQVAFLERKLSRREPVEAA